MSADRLAEIKARAEAKLAEWPDFHRDVRSPLSAAETLRIIEQVESLERWKFEAIEVMSGLRELGKALGLGLGVQITGPAALAEIERLTAERDALAQIKRHIDEVRNGTGWTVQIYGVLLQQCDQYGKTIDTRRAEQAESERDALAAQVDRVEKLAGQWDRLADTAINPDSREWLQACAATLRECLSGWQKMHAALAGSTGQECVRVDPDPGHEDEGYSCVTHNCAWDECPANQEDQS